jgi:glycosyltransferase involved in cell wall biosynthesis
MKCDLTVFILSYMRPEYLDAAINSVVCLGLSREQIVILDNGSPEYLMSKVKNTHQENVVWVGSQKNLGRGGNLARALGLVNTQYFMIFHDDDILLPNFLMSQVAILEANEKIAGISSNGYCVDEAGNRTGGLVLANMPSHGASIFFNSSQLIEHIYSDSCVPFSPTIYRSRILGQMKELLTPNFFINFGPVCDVVMQMQLADTGGICLNFSPLYECRSHSDQDSFYIDEKWNVRLRNYCYANVKGSLREIEIARKKIKDSYTCSVLYHLYKAIFYKRWRSKFLSILQSLQFKYLTFDGLSIFFSLVLKKVTG